MTRVLVDDPDLARTLIAARAKVEVCDGSGLVLGVFVPRVIEAGAEAADSVGTPRRSGDGGDDDFWKSVGID